MSVQSELPEHEQLPCPIVPDWQLKLNAAGVERPITKAESRAVT
jgi:hypothetical protein